MAETVLRAAGAAGRDKPAAAALLEKARFKAERGAQTAREIASKLPEGLDREMKADKRDGPTDPSGGVSAPGEARKAGVDPASFGAEQTRLQIKKIRAA